MRAAAAPTYSKLTRTRARNARGYKERGDLMSLDAAEQSVREGNLDAALSSLQDQVRKDPAKAELRVFLFQLLSVMGQWERALTQLNVAADLDARALAMARGMSGRQLARRSPPV